MYINKMQKHQTSELGVINLFTGFDCSNPKNLNDIINQLDLVFTYAEDNYNSLASDLTNCIPFIKKSGINFDVSLFNSYGMKNYGILIQNLEAYILNLRTINQFATNQQKINALVESSLYYAITIMIHIHKINQEYPNLLTTRYTKAFKLHQGKEKAKQTRIKNILESNPSANLSGAVEYIKKNYLKWRNKYKKCLDNNLVKNNPLLKDIPKSLKVWFNELYSDKHTHKGNYNTNRQNIKNKTIEYYFEKNGTTTKNPLIRQILNIIILKE